jgi:uncharacterized membrane protein
MPPSATPYAYQQGQVAAQKTNGKAVASLVLGLVGLVIFPIVFSVLAIIFGAIARKELKENPTLSGRGMANWGFWLGIVGLFFGVLIMAYVISQR